MPASVVGFAAGRGSHIALTTVARNVYYARDEARECRLGGKSTAVVARAGV